MGSDPRRWGKRCADEKLVQMLECDAAHSDRDFRLVTEALKYF
jgi:hypothetical protein